VINSDGTGLTPLADNDKFEHFYPAWSPDGRKIAFVAGPQGKFDIYLINPDGSELTRLTHQEASDMRPFWSPDGRQIAFTAQKGDQAAIYVIDIAQAQPIRLTAGSTPAWFGAWSPYGQQIVFLSGPERETAGLYVMNADGAGPTRLIDHPDQIFSVAWPAQIKTPALPAVAAVPTGQTDIIIVLDISGSMAAEDLQPNRLNAAKAVIRDFIDHRPGDRLGFATFASEVVGQIQPTLDHTMLKAAVDSTRLSWDIGLDSGTALGLGLNEAVEMLQDSTALNKVIILVTDGANNAGNIEPLVAAKQASAYGIRVHTIGVAQQGPARLVFPDGRIEHRDSEIDEATLQEIATLTGGRYFRAEDNEGLQKIYNSISQLEGAPQTGVITAAPALPSFAPALLPPAPPRKASPPPPPPPVGLNPI
jgi:Mg-chelatase subunit ChlD